MARNRVEYRLTGGQNTKDPADAIEDGQLQLAINTRCDEIGAISSTPGDTFMDTSVQQGTAAGDYQDNIFGMVEGYIGGTRYIFVKSQQRWLRFPYSTTPATFAAGETLLSYFPASGYPLGGVVWNGIMYLSDGYTLRRYDGTNLKRAGCQVPSAPTTATETQAGASVLDATQKWVVTYYNGIAESNFSDPKEHTFAAASKKLKLVIPVDSQTDTSTTKRRLYRTDIAGDYYYFVTEVPDNTTTSVIDPMGLVYPADSLASPGDEPKSEPRKKNRNTGAGAGGSWWERARAQYPPRTEVKDKYDPNVLYGGDIIQTNLGPLADWSDHEQASSGAAGTIRNLIMHQARAYAIRGNDTLAWSGLGNPEHWCLFDEVQIGRQAGETLLCIKAMGNDIICYTDLAIWRFRRIGMDATESILEQVTSQVGTVSSDSVAVLSDGSHIFFAKDGIYIFDGHTVQKISQEIDNIWKDSTLTSYYVDPTRTASVACIAKDKKAWFSYRTAAGTATRNINQIHVNLEFGTPRLTIDTHNAYQSYLLGSDGTIWGGTAAKISIIESANDGTDAVTWTVKTKQFPVTSALQGKRPVAIEIDAALRGATTTLTVYGDNETQIASYSLTGYDARAKIRKLLPFKGSYRRLSVQLQSLDYDQRRWYSVAFEAEESETGE